MWKFLNFPPFHPPPNGLSPRSYILLVRSSIQSMYQIKAIVTNHIDKYIYFLEIKCPVFNSIWKWASAHFQVCKEREYLICVGNIWFTYKTTFWTGIFDLHTNYLLNGNIWFTYNYRNIWTGIFDLHTKLPFDSCLKAPVSTL